MDKCLFLDVFNEKWTLFNYLRHPRVHSAIIPMKTETYFLGGTASESMTTSEILSHNSITWQEGPDIPEPGFNEGCGVRISDTEFLIIGGRNTKKILKFNTRSKEWSDTLLELQSEIVGHRCFLVERKVIITGGFDENNMVVFHSTQIIDLGEDGEMKLRKGNDMNDSRQTHGIGFVYINGTPQVIIFGGFGSSTDVYFTDTVEMWNNSNETWLKSNLTLNQGKFEFGFATLPTELMCPYFKLKKKQIRKTFICALST